MSGKMNIRILFVGDGSYPMYARAFFEAASEMDGVTAKLLDYENMNIKAFSGKNQFKRAEYHFCVGPDVTRINQKLIRECKENHYDLVFLYSAELVFASTVKQIKAMGTYVAIYHNDNPFSEKRSKFRLRHFLSSIQFSDIAYAYRVANIDDFYSHGAGKAKLLRSYFIKKRNFFDPEEHKSSLGNIPRIGFIGHYEDDGRIEYIKALSQEGVDVGVIGDWPIVNEHMKVIDNADVCYNEVLNQLDIAIVFLSTLNEDTYTRRCFEIPMTKTMMLSVYTDDIASLYETDKEIVFFRNPEEFTKKALYYLNHDDERKEIIEAAYARCLRDGHEVTDRVREIIEDYEKR